MFAHKCVFFASLCMCLVVSNAVAAPTVKRLGMASTSSGGANVTPGKAVSTSNLPRASSVRSTATSAKPVTITKNVSSNNSDNVTTSRLAVGKYLHNKGVESGVIKPATSSAEIQSDDITNLTNRVVQLENKIDEKQQELSAGDGIIIENDVISVDSSINELPNKVDEIADQLDADYYTKTEVNQLIEAQEIESTDTIYDSETGERIYVSIVDDFDKNILN